MLQNMVLTWLLTIIHKKNVKERFLWVCFCISHLKILSSRNNMSWLPLCNETWNEYLRILSDVTCLMQKHPPRCNASASVNVFTEY